MNWTDEKVLEFTKVAMGGAYGDYAGLHKIEQKLKRYKELQAAKNEAKKLLKSWSDNEKV